MRSPVHAQSHSTLAHSCFSLHQIVVQKYCSISSMWMPWRGRVVGALRGRGGVRGGRVRAVAQRGRGFLQPELGRQGQGLRPGGPRAPAQRQQLQRGGRARPRRALLRLLLTAPAPAPRVQPQRGPQQLLLHQHQLHRISADKRNGIIRLC